MDIVRKLEMQGLLRRDWDLLADLKIAHWAAVKRRLGAAAGIRAGEDLRRFVLVTHPRWPTRRDRLRDLQTHARVSAALKSVRARTR